MYIAKEDVEVLRRSSMTTEYQQYRKELVGLVNAMKIENALEETSMVLILHKLNTVEKILTFVEWCESKIVAGKLQATEVEICRAAVQAAKQQER